MKNPFDYFEAIYCINLDERIGRWNHALSQFDKLGIPDKVERFSAIKPVYDERWNQNVPWRGKNRFPLLGAVGCAESHKLIIKTAKKRNLKNVLVLEDDFMVSNNNWEDNLTEGLTELPVDWNLFYLGYDLNKYASIKSCGKNIIEVGSSKRRCILWTVGIAYNSNCFDFLIENINPFDWRKTGRQGHIDKYYARTRQLKKYCIEPTIVEPNWNFETDIQQ
tara:strand:- start:8623 stop:9285 length:663 start_codon:yes stop_codon:yes gene_type:complete